MAEERYVDIQGFEDKYMVSDHGNIYSKSLRRNKTTFQRFEDGVVTVKLYEENRRVQRSVAQLVAKHFLPNYEAHGILDHIDGDPTNNHYQNLRQPAYEKKYYPKRYWPIGRKVICVETGEIYRSAQEAAVKLRGDKASIRACCEGRRRTHKGLRFEYAEPPLIVYNDREFD